MGEPFCLAESAMLRIEYFSRLYLAVFHTSYRWLARTIRRKGAGGDRDRGVRSIPAHVPYFRHFFCPLCC